MFDPNRNVGGESKKSYQKKIESGFIDKYLSGKNILEIGYRGYGTEGVVPIVENAIGIDNGYPGYDGIHLPFESNTQDAVYSSHCLEHIPDWRIALKEWFRVLKIGGYLIVVVPHQLLYEKKKSLPSRWADHHRFYLSSKLIGEIEYSLPLGQWRLRYMCENDDGFDYDLPLTSHSVGCYEIECVIQKIKKPNYIQQMMQE